ncbi:uncharacterized protein A1O9_03849 [Exophiala aquamarina CBS 119918]|uniref:Uncharacterized protein n=1 Tax=Exophiala aquamarina CBS 119918 TaxID=1182545 RepID=A0A072PGM0_9EURO|nr:uncharacterized protein A1O9_03849 [Exophiala aquamarina CBS 119918]KEF59006.1 hypothetical protein A1O9_03849 [Exophiala aquamarina CBS 119918]
MATLFSARRKPKRIARDDPEPAQADVDEDTGPVVRRPTTSNAPKNKSKLRVSFNPGDEGEDGREGRHTSGEETQRDASTLSSRTSRLGLSSAAQTLQNRVATTRDTMADSSEGQNHERPTYSKAYLDELRNSTPSTPREISSGDSPGFDLVEAGTSTGDNTLDLASKFGPSALSSSSRIPTAAEIREKKERRARLAKERLASNTSSSKTNDNEDFIPLEAYDSDGEFKPRALQVGSYLAPAREADTRLVHDDEDIAEGFESFVDDPGRVTLSKKALKEQSKLDREAIRSMIDEAEGSDDSEGGSAAGGSDDSDYARHQAYEAAQTHRGMDGLTGHAAHRRIAARPRQPRETTAIPKLSAGLARLREMASRLGYERARIEKRRADIRRERTEIVESQVHIQTSLEEAGRELELVMLQQQKQQEEQGNSRLAAVRNGLESGASHLRPSNDHGMGAGSIGGGGATNGATQQNLVQGRGLESFGNSSEQPT